MILCQAKAENGGTFNSYYCAKDGYMLVSLYDSAYLVEHETIMTNMLHYWNIHAYMQGKYVQSMFTETKTEEKVSGKVASFAMSEATKQATKEIARLGVCDSL